MRARTAVATAVATLALAAPAHADDSSLFAAYTGHSEERDAANKAYIEASDALGTGRATDDEIRAVMVANDQINAVIATVRTETAAQEPSTEKGTRAKKLALKEFRLLIVNNRYENKSLNAYLHDDRKAGARWYRRHERMLAMYVRTYVRAHRAFKAIGFDVPPAYQPPN